MTALLELCNCVAGDKLGYQLCVDEGNGHSERDNEAVCTRENKPRITQSAAYLSRELNHLYDHGLHKKLVRGLRKP